MTGEAEANDVENRANDLRPSRCVTLSSLGILIVLGILVLLVVARLLPLLIS